MKTPKLKTKLLRMFRKRYCVIAFGKHWALIDNKKLNIISSLPFSGGRPFYTYQEAVLYGAMSLVGFMQLFEYRRIRKEREQKLVLFKTGKSPIA